MDKYTVKSKNPIPSTSNNLIATDREDIGSKRSRIDT